MMNSVKNQLKVLDKNYDVVLQAFHALKDRFEKEEQAIEFVKFQLFNPAGKDPKLPNIEEINVKEFFSKASEATNEFKVTLNEIMSSLKNCEQLFDVCNKFVNGKQEDFSLETREKIKNFVGTFLEIEA